MLLYVLSPSFRARTFVILVQPTDTVARIRAQILHYLYEMGLVDYHFKLRYRDQYLRDSYNIEDYNILPNSVLVMIPLVKQYDSASDLRSTSSQQTPKSDASGGDQQFQIKKAMEEEIEVFKLRENLVEVFRALLWVQPILCFLSIFTTYWYSVFWYLLLFIFSIFYCPNYCRTTGFTGVWSIYKERFCILYIVLGLIVFLGDVIMEVFELRKPVIYGCSAATYNSNCSVTVIFSSVFYIIHAMYLATMVGLCAGMFHNFKIDVGDFMERYLVQTRDIIRLLETARSGRVKDRRMAAFEIASMASAGDDNKFRIVAEGGLTVLISLALSSDAATQEHAVEALADLLTIPSIQSEFIAEDGTRALTALLHTPGAPKLLRDASLALSRLVQEASPDQAATVVEGRGLADLCRGVENAPSDAQRYLAGVFLELAFNASVKMVFIQNSELTLTALMTLSRCEDVETQRYAMQTLELIAIDNPDCLFQKEGLLEILLDTPWRSMETNMYVLAGRILIYFTETGEGCERMLQYPRVREALDRFSLPKDQILQKLVIRLISSLAENRSYRTTVRELQMQDILLRIKREAVDVEIAELAERAIQLIASEDETTVIKEKSSQPLSSKLGATLTAEIDGRIAQLHRESGSRVSLRSSISASTNVSSRKKRS